jgi:exonuclease III
VHEFDILFIQEITSTEVLNIYGYMTHLNVGTNMRGTAFMAKEGLTLHNVTALPTGRAMSAVFENVLLVNIYALSGTALRQEREDFYNRELVPLLRSDCEHMICGDFNCVLRPEDVTGQFSASHALQALVASFQLRDTWDQDPQRPTFIHYHPTEASRLDRFY